MDYIFLQNYLWFLVSLLGALLVFLLFVQGGNSLLFTLGRNDEERALLVNSTGRKWEFTFTTLVTFGGAFFASFPLFYSTSFGGAYWLWMIVLFSFVLQAVSYEFQSKLGNLLGKHTYQWFLVINGIVGPLLLVLFLSGVVGVLWGIGRAVFSKTATNGIWFTGIGVVLTVLALLLCAGYNNTAYYPSTADLQSSLTLANSCSSEFTLRTMAYVSILVPFVLAYIIYAWRAIDRKPITAKELEQDGHAY